jgi:hypothetical protein
MITNPNEVNKETHSVHRCLPEASPLSLIPLGRLLPGFTEQELDLLRESAEVRRNQVRHVV